MFFYPLWIMPTQLMLAGMQTAAAFWTAPLAAWTPRRRDHVQVAWSNPHVLRTAFKGQLTLAYSRGF